MKKPSETLIAAKTQPILHLRRVPFLHLFQRAVEFFHPRKIFGSLVSYAILFGFVLFDMSGVTHLCSNEKNVDESIDSPSRLKSFVTRLRRRELSSQLSPARRQRFFETLESREVMAGVVMALGNRQRCYTTYPHLRGRRTDHRVDIRILPIHRHRIRWRYLIGYRKPSILNPISRWGFTRKS